MRSSPRLARAAAGAASFLFALAIVALYLLVLTRGSIFGIGS